MADPGLSPTGLVIRTQPDLQARLEQAVDAVEPGTNLRAGPVQQLIGVISEEIALGWEALLGVYGSGFRSSAIGLALDEVIALTGAKRRAATKSRVVAKLHVAASTTLAAGIVLAVEGNPDAQFQTVEAAVNPAGIAADIEVVAEALVTGPVAAPEDKLTVIVQPVTGLTAVTNDDDAELGQDAAADPEARATQRIELPSGSRTVPSIRSAVRRVDGVLEVTVKENVTMVVDVDGRPAKSIEAIVWDGSPPPVPSNDDAIAQALYDRKPDGIQVFGVGSSGTATDDVGDEHTVAFTRATKVRVYVVAEVVLAPGTGGGWVAQAQAAVAARGALYKVGETAYASQFICALLEVPGVVAVTTLTIGTAPAPVGVSVAADYNEIIRVDSGDVDASEA